MAADFFITAFIAPRIADRTVTGPEDGLVEHVVGRAEGVHVTAGRFGKAAAMFGVDGR